MTYSACDFTSDVLRCLGEAGAMRATGSDGDDLGHQADAAISAITALSAQACAARFLGELLSASGSLSALRETFGTHSSTCFTLSMRLQRAV
jgi:hypothetical protein